MTIQWHPEAVSSVPTCTTPWKSNLSAEEYEKDVWNRRRKYLRWQARLLIVVLDKEPTKHSLSKSASWLTGST